MVLRADQNGMPQNRIVRYVGELDNPGFLLSRTGPMASAKFWAHFVDGFTEEINPPTGSPRPEPETAVRTQRQSLPPSLRTQPFPSVLASMFSGQMRTVVQCEFSRGQETKFSHTWGRTHGLLEFPYPHVSGGDANAEALARTQRTYFIIEVSSSGIFAAPVKFGRNCATCAKVQEYMPQGAPQLNLAAYHSEHPNGRVQRVMTAAQIAPAYAAGSPWYAQCGWAFSYSGRRAANVVSRGDNSTGFPSHLTTLLRLAFSVTITGSKAATIVRLGNIARVSFGSPHGFIENETVVVQGAIEEQYNGVRVATNVTPLTLDYNLDPSNLPSSPATGDVRIANANNKALVSATLSKEEGRVLFKRSNNGTLWFPEGPGQWRGVNPPPVNQTCDGPVHVFYDGEEEVVTRWRNTVANFPRVEVIPPGDDNVNWQGGLSGTQAVSSEVVQSMHICQHPTCITEWSELITSGFGSLMSAHTMTTYGFYGWADGTVQQYGNRTNNTASTGPGGTANVITEVFSNFYDLCPDCYFVNADGVLQRYGISTIELTYTEIYCHMQVIMRTESAGGTSAGIMYREDREAFSILHAQGESATQEAYTSTGRYRNHRKEIKLDGNGDPFTNIDIPSQIAGFFEGRTPSIVTHPTSASGRFMTRAGAELSLSTPETVIPNVGFQNPALSPFERYDNTKETAESNIFIIRGGLYYSEPDLSPPNQRGNFVYSLGGALTTLGGFAGVVGVPVGFVGRV